MKRTVVVLLVLVLLSIAVHGSVLAQTIKVGVTPGPHEEIMEIVQGILARDGIQVQIVSFTDYVTPNLVLAAGEIDANSYQHIPYLEQFVSDRNVDLIWIAPTVIFPMGLYSSRLDSLSELKNNSVVSIPNDPTNGGRALLLLQSAGLLTLQEGTGIAATTFDIKSNPYNLRIVEMDAANLPRSLQDVHIAAINTNYAIEAGINPVTDSLFIENADSPWVNVLAVRGQDKDDPIFQTLIAAYQSKEVFDFVLERFQGSVVPGFEIE